MAPTFVKNNAVTLKGTGNEVLSHLGNLCTKNWLRSSLLQLLPETIARFPSHIVEDELVENRLRVSQGNVCCVPEVRMESKGGHRGPQCPNYPPGYALCVAELGDSLVLTALPGFLSSPSLVNTA